MVNIFYTQLSGELNPRDYSQYLNKLPLELREKNLRYHRWQDRTSHLMGNLLLIEAISLYGFDHLHLSNLKYNAYGKPHLPNEFDFNITHSGSYVMCAISTSTKLGIDLEEIRPIDLVDFENTMTGDQWALIRSSTSPIQEFFKYWTIKESVIKADSRGLSIRLDSIFIENDLAIVDGKKWYLHQLRIDDQYSVHLATEHHVADAIRLSEVNFYQRSTRDILI